METCPLYMEIRLQDLLEWSSKAVEAGVQAYIRHTEPEKDRIRQSEAKRYIVNLGYKPIMLRKWTEANLLRCKKTGEKQNASVWYSLAEIKNLISTLRLKEICNEQK